MYDFGKETYFDAKAPGKRSVRDRTLIRLLESPGLMISAFRISNKKYLPSDPNELCNRLKLLLQEKHAGNNSDIINEEIVIIVDNLLEY